MNGKKEFIEGLKCTAVLVVSLLAFVVGTLFLTNVVLAADEYPNEYAQLLSNMSQEDYDYLAKCVMCEAGQSNLECAEATVCVILNRVLDQEHFKYRNTVKDVVLQPGQFSTRYKFANAKPNNLTYSAIANVQNHGARVIRDKLAEQGWDYQVTDYLFFDVKKQPGYSANFLLCGIDDPGQHHYIGTARGK